MLVTWMFSKWKHENPSEIRQSREQCVLITRIREEIGQFQTLVQFELICAPTIDNGQIRMPTQLSFIFCSVVLWPIKVSKNSIEDGIWKYLY